MGGKGGGRVGTCELQAHEEGGEANKGGHMEGGAGAPGACYVGEHVVVRALGGYATDIFLLLRNVAFTLCLAKGLAKSSGSAFWDLGRIHK